MISSITNQTISIFILPDKLREIANCLERQQERLRSYQEGTLVHTRHTIEESLDSIHCQIHDKDVQVWFRLPNVNEKLQ